MNTLPDVIGPKLIDFCRSLSTERPRFVPSRPSADARASMCFDNVLRKVERAGGQIVHGWAIWHMPGIYFEAEHHGVWRNRAGRLVDVSPQPYQHRRIVFLPDDAAVYDPEHPRSNVIAVEPGREAADRLVMLARRRIALLDSYRQQGGVLAILSDGDASELAVLEREMAQELDLLRV